MTVVRAVPESMQDIETAEEKNFRIAQEVVISDEQREEILAQEAHMKEKVLHKKQKNNKECQQKYHDNKQKTKEAEGWVPQPGNCKKGVEHDDMGNGDNSCTAEMSCPHCQFKKDAQLKKNTVRWLHKYAKIDAICTNYFHLLLWDDVEAARQATGSEFSPWAITKWLKEKFPKCFGQLAKQTVGG
ncbi:hypothetical protein ARMSODRAFT_981159 [Armillaria solidipes]|uniref:Uncharacterized protein n=1 Tax=Armillaria solidipes TaxID=1076256 RepID=A0A2H3AW44_9AGAR|nr:hypothetical protein ARMSODRAFT_981159 [Armillaria solidipes]